MNRKFTLTQWQNRQATLLYYFASLEYLIGLKDRVNNLKKFAEEKLDQSRAQGRDRFLKNLKWGDRDTTENWANNAWPFLADFQASVAQAIADLPADVYHVTDANHCLRGMNEFSMQWATTDEENKFSEMLAEISRYSSNIDYTMQKRYGVSWWDDFCLTQAWTEHAGKFQQIPKFNVHTDVVSETDKAPPRTGVYVSVDDPNASLQFAWNGAPGGELLPASTLNDLGLAALSTVGRRRLWTDQLAMREFVCANLSHPKLTNDPQFEGPPTPELAPGLVASNAFTSLSTRWYFVERIEGEYVLAEGEADPISTESSAENRRFSAGELCTRTGYYFTPASLTSRRQFHTGEVFPDLDSAYGKTIWQWAAQQE